VNLEVTHVEIYEIELTKQAGDKRDRDGPKNRNSENWRSSRFRGDYIKRTLKKNQKRNIKVSRQN
jgi:hypothetical protein